MIRTLYRRLLAWLYACRVDGCDAPMVIVPVCGRHLLMWRDHVKAMPVQPMDPKARDRSRRQWVRDVNEQKRGR